jgi:membrane protein required for colicin V production
MGTVADILILALVALMTFRGLRRGALSTIVSLASYGLAYLMATLVYKTSHLQLVQAYGEVGLYLVILPAVFIVTIILVRFLGRTATRTLNLTLAGPVNKLLGGALGFMKAVVVVLAFAATIKFLSPVTGEWYTDSQALPFLLQLFG